MPLFLGILGTILLLIVILQIARIAEITGVLRGERAQQFRTNSIQTKLGVLFMVAFLVAMGVSTWCYKNWLLGYGPHESASAHGVELDSLFNTTTIVTGLVFVLTQVLLFWFAFKYRGRANHQAVHISHDNRLEMVWMIVPTIVMATLVVFGLRAWNNVMADVTEDEDYIEIEATGMQFAWIIRYPGPDGKLGDRYYKNITGANPLGQLWQDERNLDDFQPNEIVLPVNKKVRVKITARDVLHNFYLPHFRVKMDAVPGMPTYFVFTPTKTTNDYRKGLSKYAEYQAPADPSDPESPTLWESFNYELACAELCGSGHFSMRTPVRIVSESEYNVWLSEQKSYYMSSIRNSDDDPNKGRLLDVEIDARIDEFSGEVDKLFAAPDISSGAIVLKHLWFETGSSQLHRDSKFELRNILDAMEKHTSMKIRLEGHTDSTGDNEKNIALSLERAEVAKNYLIGKGIDANRIETAGYGSSQPIGDNATADGRQLNRRTELRILSK